MAEVRRPAKTHPPRRHARLVAVRVPQLSYKGSGPCAVRSLLSHHNYTTHSSTYHSYQHGRYLHLPEQLRVRSPFYSAGGYLAYLTCSSVSDCGPNGTGCACAKGQCNCNNCPNKASAQQSSVSAPAPFSACRAVLTSAV